MPVGGAGPEYETLACSKVAVWSITSEAICFARNCNRYGLDTIQQ
jgi:hypothetical protein